MQLHTFVIGIESGKHFACAAFVRTTVETFIPFPLQRLHGFGYNGIVRIHLSTWLVLQLEGSVHSVPRDVTLPSLDRRKAAKANQFLVVLYQLSCFHEGRTAGLGRKDGIRKEGCACSTAANCGGPLQPPCILFSCEVVLAWLLRLLVLLGQVFWYFAGQPHDLLMGL